MFLTYCIRKQDVRTVSISQYSRCIIQRPSLPGHLQNLHGLSLSTFDWSVVDSEAQRGLPVRDDLMTCNDAKSGKMHYM